MAQAVRIILSVAIRGCCLDWWLKKQSLVFSFPWKSRLIMGGVIWLPIHPTYERRLTLFSILIIIFFKATLLVWILIFLQINCFELRLLCGQVRLQILVLSNVNIIIYIWLNMYLEFWVTVFFNWIILIL